MLAFKKTNVNNVYFSTKKDLLKKHSLVNST